MLQSYDCDYQPQVHDEALEGGPQEHAGGRDEIALQPCLYGLEGGVGDEYRYRPGEADPERPNAPQAGIPGGENAEQRRSDPDRKADSEDYIRHRLGSPAQFLYAPELGAVAILFDMARHARTLLLTLCLTAQSCDSLHLLQIALEVLELYPASKQRLECH